MAYKCLFGLLATTVKHNFFLGMCPAVVKTSSHDRHYFFANSIKGFIFPLSAFFKAAMYSFLVLFALCIFD
jgi:hypothetical protein